MNALPRVVVAVTLMSLTQSGPPRIKVGDARRFVGKEVTVCGRVVTYDCNDSHQIVFLDLDKPYWAGSTSIGVRSADRPAFGERFEDELLGTNVCATGRVERLDGRNVIVVNKRDGLTAEARTGFIAPPFGPGAFQDCVDGAVKPTLIRDVKPTYTGAAMQARIQGLLLVDAVVLPNGTVGDVRILYSLDRDLGLDQAGVAAIRQWRFKPGTIRGAIVPMIVRIELSFRLK